MDVLHIVFSLMYDSGRNRVFFLLLLLLLFFFFFLFYFYIFLFIWHAYIGVNVSVLRSEVDNFPSLLFMAWPIQPKLGIIFHTHLFTFMSM